ncbi:metal-dependent transcriptional regulator [Antribacter gilvus]|uniref:metal-dependent transcriptional regulator n=1 Tax=Antribacter gilvus TaxID=2304675 RepID=UPI000F770F3B|nr:metal-dependent transcriptional regulator [Antribacter gilvus]
MEEPPNPAELTAVAQDYLKAVWSAQEWSDEKVTTKHLADRMGVGASTVSETVRRLSTQGLLEHEPYGGIELTETGRGLALAMVRRHRLLETYLVCELGYGWDEVHDEAEVLEHAVSDLLVDRIDARLGHPSRDPHGDPIPGADGTVVRPHAVPLSSMAAGAAGPVVRISDADPEALRYLGQIGFDLDVEVEVVARREYAGTVAVRWTRPGSQADGGAPDEHSADLGLLAASRVWVGVPG